MKQLEKLLKKISLSLLSPFFKIKTKKSSVLDWKKFKRVLIFRLDNRLGNAILILPLIRSIKQSLPKVKIDVMMSIDYIQIYEGHPDINKIIDYNQSNLMKNPFRYLDLINKLRKNDYDVVFSSSNANAFSVSQAIFAGLLGANYTVGFDWQDSNKLYTNVVKGNTDIQYGEAQVDLWRHFDVEARVEAPRIYFVSTKNVQSLNKNVLFWLGATANKILPEKLISKVLGILKNNDINYHLAAGPADENLFNNYPADWKQNTRFLRGSIKDTAKYFLQFNMIIMPDTGPMHLAVALGIPTVQVFVNSDPTWYAYKEQHNYVVNKSVNENDFEAYLDKILIKN